MARKYSKYGNRRFRRAYRKGKKSSGLKRMIKSVVMRTAETKYSKPAAVVNSTVSANGFFYQFHTPPLFVQGTFGQTGYLGASITNRRLTMHYNIVSALDVEINTVRVVIGWAPNDTFGITECLQAMPNVLSPWNHLIQKAYILYDKSILVDNGNNDIPGTVNRKLSLNLKNIQTTFKASSGNGTKNVLFMYVQSDSQFVGHPSINFDYNLTYKDV